MGSGFFACWLPGRHVTPSSYKSTVTHVVLYGPSNTVSHISVPGNDFISAYMLSKDKYHSILQLIQ